MFQRLSNLLFGEVEVVSADLKGPKPSVTEAEEEGWLLVSLTEGAPAQPSPMEDLLIEHPSMSVYVSPGNLSVVEQAAGKPTGSASVMSDSTLPPVAKSSMPTRMSRGAARQALAKVTQVSRVQRAKARADRRPLGQNRMQRQNHVRERIPRHTAHLRNSFLHQPCQRSLCH